MDIEWARYVQKFNQVNIFIILFIFQLKINFNDVI